MSSKSSARIRWTALALASVGVLTFGATAQADKADSKLVRTADGIEIRQDADACGGTGTTGTKIPATGQVLCTHTAPDFGPKHTALARTGPVAALPTQPSTMARTPECYGDGKSGKRVQAIYAYPSSRAARPEVVTAIKNVYSRNMEGLVRAESARSGKELGIRFDMSTGCGAVSVPTVKLPADAGTVNGSQFGRIANHLADKGYNRGDRKYVVWWDGNGAACGIGTMLPLAESDPTPANPHNGHVGGDFYPLALNMAQIYGPCWGNGTSGANTEIHELFHTLGSVMLNSPRSNGLGHCYDEPDIMCYSEGGVNTRTECFTSYEQLDCNKNDYFNPKPAPNSYLSTHWNTANSRFLDAFPLTDLAPTLPAGLESP